MAHNQPGSSKDQAAPDDDIPLKIRRVTKACDLCRKRKARCDGDPASPSGVSMTGENRQGSIKLFRRVQPNSDYLITVYAMYEYGGGVRFYTFCKSRLAFNLVCHSRLTTLTPETRS